MPRYLKAQCSIEANKGYERCAYARNDNKDHVIPQVEDYCCKGGWAAARTNRPVLLRSSKYVAN